MIGLPPKTSGLTAMRSNRFSIGYLFAQVAWLPFQSADRRRVSQTAPTHISKLGNGAGQGVSHKGRRNGTRTLGLPYTHIYRRLAHHLFFSRSNTTFMAFATPSFLTGLLYTSAHLARRIESEYLWYR